MSYLWYICRSLIMLHFRAPAKCSSTLYTNVESLWTEALSLQIALLSSFPQDPDGTTTTQTFGPVFSIKPSFMKFRVSLGTSLIKNVKKRLRLVLLTYYKMIKELSDIKRKTAIRNCMNPDVPVLVQVFQVIKDHWFLDNTLRNVKSVALTSSSLAPGKATCR